MQIDVNVDAAAVNKMVTDAILESAIGETLREVVAIASMVTPYIVTMMRGRTARENAGALGTPTPLRHIWMSRSPDLSKPFTLRMAGYELIGREATEAIIEKQTPEWLVFVLLSYIESNNVQTETANLLRDWHDRRQARPPTLKEKCDD